MAIQLKNNGDDETNESLEVSSDFYEKEEGNSSSKYRGREVDLNNLPTYTGPTYIPDNGAGVSSGKKQRSIITGVIVGAIVIAAIVLIAYGAHYMTGSGGKDITSSLTKTEEELAKEFGVTFEDNADKVKSVRQYSNGTVTVRSAKELNVIYINGKQCGINTSSRKYRFFDIGINDPKYTAESETTYNYESSFVVANELIGGNSETNYYFNRKNNDCLVLVVNKGTNRVVDMTYYTDYKKISENLSSTEED